MKIKLLIGTITMIKDRFGITIFPEPRFETLGALADFIEDKW